MTGGLPALDDHGMAAFCCGDDGGTMAPAPDAPAVLVCPTCGHRTDTPGTGVLADGFDVVHRQWGARGDVHAWRTMRARLADQPTPADADALRAVFVAALGEVADLDPESVEGRVHRSHLDHGGMGGGFVDLDWWRAKGLPLLVDRAIARRPTGPADRPGASRRAAPLVRGALLWVLIMALPAALVGGGGWQLYQRAYGERVAATVLSCDSSGHFRRYGSTFRTECVAQWTLDGEVRIGNFEGGNGESDVGKTVGATVRGDTAYSRSLGLPVLLIALGLPWFALPVLAWRQRVRRGGSAPSPPATPRAARPAR